MCLKRERGLSRFLVSGVELGMSFFFVFKMAGDSAGLSNSSRIGGKQGYLQKKI